METRVNYTLVGAFVVIFGTLLLCIAVWLSFGFKRESYTTYLAYFQGSVSGLNTNSTVRYNGVPVGYVSDIALVPKQPGTVKLHLKIKSNVFVTEDATAYLQTQGLTGIAYVELQGGSPNAPPLAPIKGQKYGILQTMPAFNINSVSDSLRTLLSQKNIAHFSILLANLSKASNQLPAALENFTKAAASMEKMSVSVGAAGDQVNLTMQDGRVALQGLADQAMPETVLALGDLRQLLVSLQQLNNLLQQNPSVLLRGKKPLPPGPGEKSNAG